MGRASDTGAAPRRINGRLYQWALMLARSVARCQGCRRRAGGRVVSVTSSACWKSAPGTLLTSLNSTALLRLHAEQDEQRPVQPLLGRAGQVAGRRVGASGRAGSAASVSSHAAEVTAGHARHVARCTSLGHVTSVVEADSSGRAVRTAPAGCCRLARRLIRIRGRVTSVGTTSGSRGQRPITPGRPASENPIAPRPGENNDRN